MLEAEGIGLAEGGDAGTKVVNPDFFCVSGIGLSAGEEEDIGLDPFGVEDAGRQAEDGMEVAAVQQVFSDFFAVAVRKEDVIGKDGCRSGFAVGFEATVDVL